MKIKDRVNYVIIAFGLFLIAGTANAFDFPPPPPPLYQGLIIPLFPNNGHVNVTVTPPTKPSPATVTTLAPHITGVPQGPAKLALKAPVNLRAQVKVAYTNSFNLYKKLERLLGIPNDDVAGAMAAYIAGNYIAANNVNIPDATFKVLVNQMRTLLVKIPAFKNASKAAKRDLYEQMAIIGTFMTLANIELKKPPLNPALITKFRSTAKNNLKQFLGVYAVKVKITSIGLAILP
jgi:dimeric dUTPase (all-alpha-NTP-PPase superfamily)